jgi:N-hydroxyarylamine O-acetyltransferase
MIKEYLKRIDVDQAGVHADLATLKMLQRQHLMHVPFENLDIHWQRPITVDAGRFFEKIVADGRGGFCYELNGLFNELLRGVGFETRIVSARVFDGTDFGPEFDHAAIIVTIGEQEYLADVGFGDFAAEPLQLIPGIEQQDREGTFRIDRGEYGTLVVAKRSGEEWVPEYSFTLLGRDLSEFAEMCDYQQYSPDSHFTKGKVCSILTDTGRKTLTDKKFIVTSNGRKTETPVGSAEEFDLILKDEFSIDPVAA